jgi:tRNA pseudouridine38-40 synthase
MVRRIVGVLAAAGRGELTSADGAAMMESESDLPGTLTAPASGLFLERVFYRGDNPPGPVTRFPTVSRPF